MKRTHVVIGLTLTLIILAVHLRLMDDYGLTWDFHHHFFAGMHLLKQPITPEITANLPFSEPDPRGTYNLPFGPLMSIAPVATYLVFFKWLGLLAFDNAYNLAIVASGTAGIFILYLFLLEAFDFVTGLAGLMFLALFPRYFGDLHNNMKDVPQAAAFALALWMFWRLVTYKRLKNLVWASFAFAIAFNTKVNTIMVPVIAGVWLLLQKIPSIKHQISNKHQASSIKSQKKLFRNWDFEHWNLFGIWNLEFGYFLFAPLCAFLLWSLFWKNPIKQLLYIPRFFIDNTQNIEVLIHGTWYCSGLNVPWWYPLWYLGVTTPLPTLLFFLIGLAVIVHGLIRRVFFTSNHEKDTTTLLLVLWFFLPLVRYIFPRMGVIDGIRHFEEVVFPLSAIAAVGFTFLFKRIIGRIGQIGRITIIGALLLSLLLPIMRYHPYQISYFNELVGGIKGAMGKYDIDYWGGPQKKAIDWLNDHAPNDARIHVVMAADVAGTYLRSDLRAKLNTVGYDQSDYVVVLNRQSFFYRYFYLWEYMLRRKTAYVVETQGVPVVWVFDNRLGQFPRAQEWWYGQSPCVRPYWKKGT